MAEMKINYKNIKVQETLDPVDPKMIEQTIANELAANATLTFTDGPAMNHDVVIIDFEGFLDGVAFPGGAAKDYELELGSSTLIPGFEPQLIGLKAGDTKSVFVTFPQDYAEESLAGKRAEFRCKVNKVFKKIVPALDQAFAEKQGFKSVSEYRMDVSNRIDKELRSTAKFKAISEVIERIAKANPFEIPSDLLEDAVDRYVVDFLAQYYGVTDVDQFCAATGASKEELRERLTPAAESRLRGDIIMAAIDEEQGFEVTDEEYENEVANVAARYFTDENTVKQQFPREVIEQNIRLTKTIDYLYETCVTKGSRIILG